MSNYDLIAKSIFVGDSESGKTMILNYIKTGEVCEKYTPTIEINIVVKTCQTDSGYIIKHQLWDTPGAPKFRRVIFSYYHGCRAIIVVHRENSSIKEWIDLINKIKPTPLIFDVTTFVTPLPGNISQGVDGKYYVRLDTGEGINNLITDMTEIFSADPEVKTAYNRRLKEQESLRQEEELERVRESEMLIDVGIRGRLMRELIETHNPHRYLPFE